MDVNSAELREFQDRGGKLLMYQGWNDYPLRPQRALDYLSLAEAQNGGAENTSEFFRLFMVPGMQHCAGGPGPWQADYVDPIVDWVENGKAPERIIGKQPGIVTMKDIFAGIEPAKDAKVFTRPLCPHPQSAKYSGRGNVDDASSWDCAAN
jgi:feruloyl esterase